MSRRRRAGVVVGVVLGALALFVVVDWARVKLVERNDRRSTEELRAQWRPVVRALDALHTPPGWTRCPEAPGPSLGQEGEQAYRSVFPHGTPCWTARQPAVTVAASLVAGLRTARSTGVDADCVRPVDGDVRCDVRADLVGIPVGCNVLAASERGFVDALPAAAGVRVECLPLPEDERLHPARFPSTLPRVPLPSPSP